MGSVWGNALTLSIFGESHGPAIGVVLDGFPVGVRIDEGLLKAEMARRRPGQKNAASTPRSEADEVRFLSGVIDAGAPAGGEGSGKSCCTASPETGGTLVTTGAPIAIMIENTDTRSGDYSQFRVKPRPGHADLTAHLRYGGYNDIRGGGHFSGRLTAPLVAAGALCRMWLNRDGIDITGEILTMGDIEAARAEGDSVGGMVRVRARGLPAGWGDPMFGGVESRIAGLVLSIPACKGIAFGTGFGLADMRGSEANNIEANHNGGVLGGITDGQDIVFDAVFKPTPSIAREQVVRNLVTGEMDTLSIPGRHDACIVPRALPVCEAALAIVLADLKLEMEGKGC